MSGPGMRPDVDWHGGHVASGVVCVLAPNPGPMTLDGTNTWVLAGRAGAVVIDPGPGDDEHLRAVLRVARELSGRVGQIWLTHGHLDHSEGAVRLAELAAASVRALDPFHRLGSEGLTEGDAVDLGDAELRVLASPGHTRDSLSFVLHRQERRSLLTGDTVLGRGTTVVAHPDGELGAYLATLTRLRDATEHAEAWQVLPGHGPVLDDAHAALADYLAHRHERLDQVRAALLAGDSSADEVLARVYADVDRRLWPAARRSVMAQLEYLGHPMPGA